MSVTAKIISCYAADTSGVCSALYEMGSMTVIHDASGCNSTYTTHDEPRWYDKKSMVFISALTERDAVLGGDQKLIDDVCAAAKRLRPAFITLCGSPMPIMTGVDFTALADEISNRCGLTVLGIDTDAMSSYILGAAQALFMAANRFCREDCEYSAEEGKIGVNIIGATPLDFSVNGSAQDIEKWLVQNGFEVVSRFGMDSDFEQIKRAGAAKVSLVVSYCGVAAAEYLYAKFGIPYVVGVPIGTAFPKALLERLMQAYAGGEKSYYPCTYRKASGAKRIAVIGESVYSGSLAAEISLETGRDTVLICPLDCDKRLIAKNDLKIKTESAIMSQLRSSDICAVIADPLYKPICPADKTFYPLPHEAFSGRCFRKDIPNLINRNLKELGI